MKQVEEITEIPFSGQKLICQAKTLTSNDPYKTSLASCNLITGSKVMVLGRKTDPEKDESYQKIVAIEKNILDMAQKFVDISKQVQEITHLPKEHHESALRVLEKRSKACSEKWMHSLENLDAIQLDDTQIMSKSKCKSVVNCAKSYMNQADELMQQIKTLLNSLNQQKISSLQSESLTRENIVKFICAKNETRTNKITPLSKDSAYKSEYINYVCSRLKIQKSEVPPSVHNDIKIIKDYYLKANRTIPNMLKNHQKFFSAIVKPKRSASPIPKMV